MDRREKLLGDLQLDRLVGLEIGALASPLVKRSDGPVIYVDHADTQALREKYREHTWIDPDAIVQVDAVWGEQSIREALGPERSVDYVVASHVVEHVPDLVAWLQDLESVLRPGGSVRLAIPDKRFCFDYLRSETRVTDILHAHYHRARRPQPREIIDSEIYHRDVDPHEAWAGRVELATLLQPDQLTRVFGLANWSARGEYVDVHCWAFTLQSFAAVMEQLASLGLTTLACERAFDTEVNTHEFFVIMRPAARLQAVESWAAPKGADTSLERQQQTALIEHLRRQLQDARDELAALRNSTSWRLTQPLRQAVERLRR
jgi:SAM-dependent methyltransferase